MTRTILRLSTSNLSNLKLNQNTTGEVTLKEICNEQPTSKTPDRKSALKTVTKKGITVNPKKEDLMKETMKAKLGASMDALKKAKKSAKGKTKGKVKRWWDDDGDGIGYSHEVK